MMSKSRSVMMPPGCQIRLVSAIRTAGLPLDVVEIAVGAPDRERFRRIQKHAIERFDALDVEHVAVARGEKDVLYGARGV